MGPKRALFTKGKGPYSIKLKLLGKYTIKAFKRTLNHPNPTRGSDFKNLVYKNVVFASVYNRYQNNHIHILVYTSIY